MSVCHSIILYSHFFFPPLFSHAFVLAVCIKITFYYYNKNLGMSSLHISGSSGPSTSSIDSDGGDSVHWLSPPLGPLSAFDLFHGRHAFFEEKHNRVLVVKQGSPADDVSRGYAVPVEYGFGRFYWARIFFVKEEILLCLLKDHATKLFSLVTFRLDDETKSCQFLATEKTDIFTEGYQIWSQRCGSRFYFSFTNRPPLEKKKLMKSVSDKALFQEQMRTVIENGNEKNTESASAIMSHRRTTSTESADVHRQTYRHEAVMLCVTVDARGGITCSVMTIGRRKARLAMRKEKNSQPIKRSIRMKHMNRLSTHEDIDWHVPFFYADHAIFISREKPNEAIVVPTRVQGQFSILSAVTEKIKSRSRVDADVRDIAISGEAPPGGSAIWSDFHIEDNAAYVAVQTDESSVRLYRLHISASLSLSWEALSLSPSPPSVQSMRLTLADRSVCLRGCAEPQAGSEEVQHFCVTFANRLTV